MVRDQLQCMLQSALLECGTLAKPSTVQAVVLAAGLFLVINKLCYCTKQTPSGIFCSQQFSATPMAFKQGLNLLEGAFVSKARYT